MSLITESYLRQKFLNKEIPVNFHLSSHDKLTPAALDFLKERKIAILKSIEEYNTPLVNRDMPEFSFPRKGKEWKTDDSFVNFYTSEVMDSKPESMTHLFNNVLVYKNDPRIILRGRLDTLQALIIDIQVYFCELNKQELVENLEDLLAYTRNILGCEVLNQPLPDINVLGMTADQIREHSHHPEKYFGLKQMVLVNYKQGTVVSKLNYLRAVSRECELIAVNAFRNGNHIEQNSLIQGLNRLSSCFHILMYKELAKRFQ